MNFSYYVIVVSKTRTMYATKQPAKLGRTRLYKTAVLWEIDALKFSKF